MSSPSPAAAARPEGGEVSRVPAPPPLLHPISSPVSPFPFGTLLYLPPSLLLSPALRSRQTVGRGQPCVGDWSWRGPLPPLLLAPATSSSSALPASFLIALSIEFEWSSPVQARQPPGAAASSVSSSTLVAQPDLCRRVAFDVMCGSAPLVASYPPAFRADARRSCPSPPSICHLLKPGAGFPPSSCFFVCLAVAVAASCTWDLRVKADNRLLLPSFPPSVHRAECVVHVSTR
jgi:hypothetical protein